MTQEEFDRRLAAIERAASSGYGEPPPAKPALDAAYAALAELAGDPETQGDRVRTRSVAMVAETLQRTYAALKLPVPEV